MPHSPLITPRRLAELEQPVVLLDARFRLGGPPGYGEFLRGHIPGASYVDLDTDLADPAGARGRHPLPEVGRFEAAMRRCGVSAGVPVVVYDAMAGTSRISVRPTALPARGPRSGTRCSAASTTGAG